MFFLNQIFSYQSEIPKNNEILFLSENKNIFVKIIIGEDLTCQDLFIKYYEDINKASPEPINPMDVKDYKFFLIKQNDNNCRFILDEQTCPFIYLKKDPTLFLFYFNPLNLLNNSENNIKSNIIFQNKLMKYKQEAIKLSKFSKLSHSVLIKEFDDVQKYSKKLENFEKNILQIYNEKFNYFKMKKRGNNKLKEVKFQNVKNIEEFHKLTEKNNEIENTVKDKMNDICLKISLIVPEGKSIFFTFPDKRKFYDWMALFLNQFEICTLIKYNNLLHLDNMKISNKENKYEIKMANSLSEFESIISSFLCRKIFFNFHRKISTDIIDVYENICMYKLYLENKDYFAAWKIFELIVLSFKKNNTLYNIKNNKRLKDIYDLYEKCLNESDNNQFKNNILSLKENANIFNEISSEIMNNYFKSRYNNIIKIEKENKYRKTINYYLKGNADKKYNLKKIKLLNLSISVKKLIIE